MTRKKETPSLSVFPNVNCTQGSEFPGLSHFRLEILLL
jgi:hypothetical protein